MFHCSEKSALEWPCKSWTFYPVEWPEYQKWIHAQQIALMKDFQQPNACGWFDYDIIRGQHQALTWQIANSYKRCYRLCSGIFFISFWLHKQISKFCDSFLNILGGWLFHGPECRSLTWKFYGLWLFFTITNHNHRPLFFQIACLQF